MGRCEFGESGPDARLQDKQRERTPGASGLLSWRVV